MRGATALGTGVWGCVTGKPSLTDPSAWLVVEVDPEKLLADSEVVTGNQIYLVPDAQETAVRRSEIDERELKPGMAIGLAWTPFGGDVLFVESTVMPGSKGLVLTGQLGDVMKESVTAALSYIRTNAKKFKIDPVIFEKSDIHIHLPAGAVPKDGPSAGVTMLTALVSLLTDRRVAPRLAQ